MEETTKCDCPYRRAVGCAAVRTTRRCRQPLIQNCPGTKGDVILDLIAGIEHHGKGSGVREQAHSLQLGDRDTPRDAGIENTRSARGQHSYVRYRSECRRPRCRREVRKLALTLSGRVRRARPIAARQGCDLRFRGRHLWARLVFKPRASIP